MSKRAAGIGTLKPAVALLQVGPALLVSRGTADPTSWRSGLTSTQRGYGYKWQKAREGFLRKHPICEICEKSNRIEASTVVDHKIAHRGDQALFWDRNNWQALCETCHNTHAQRRDHEAARLGIPPRP